MRSSLENLQLCTVANYNLLIAVESGDEVSAAFYQSHLRTFYQEGIGI